MDITQQLRLISSHNWTGLGFEWMEKVAGEAAIEIERLRKEKQALACEAHSYLSQLVQPE